MYELTDFQRVIYDSNKAGVSQMMTLTGSIILPDVVYEADLQRAVNEVFRLNDSLRMRFIEQGDKVYQEPKPFVEQQFDVMYFDSPEQMTAWAEVYATIPLKLDIQADKSAARKGGNKKGSAASEVKITPNLIAMVANGVGHSIHTAYKRVRLGIKTVPACCEVKLVKLPGASGAIIKANHIVSDAWTMMMIANQFIQLLRGEEPVAYQYDEFVESEKEYLQSESYERDRLFYEKQYEKFPEPTYVWAGEVTSLVSNRTTVSVDADLTSQMEDYAAANQTSPFILFMTAFGVYLGRKMNRDKLYIGSTCINRSGLRERNIVGLFANNVPVLLEFDANASFADAVQRVRNANFACFRHQKGFKLSIGQDGIPYSVAISFQNATLEADSNARLAEYHNRYFFHGMMIRIENSDADGHFKVHFDHNPQAVPEEDVAEIERVAFAILREGIADDSRPVGELGL